MKRLIAVCLAVGLSSSAWAGAGAPARPVADQLAVAAAKAALDELSHPRVKGLDATGARLTLEEAIAQLGRAGDLDDLRALVTSADASNPQLSGFLILAHARLGDRAEVDQRVAAVDPHKALLGKEAPAWACTVALAYEVLGDTAAADARLLEAHADCPGYLADEDVASGHAARALAILDAAKPPVDALAQARRAAQRARAHAKDARAAIADAAKRLEQDQPRDHAVDLLWLASAAAKAGWKADARDLLARTIAITPADDEVTQDEILDDAPSIDHAIAVKLVTARYGKLGADAEVYELIAAATAWARVGDRAKANKLLAAAQHLQASPRPARAAGSGDPPPPPPDDPSDPSDPLDPLPAAAPAAPVALTGPTMAWLYTELGQLDLAILAVAQPGDLRRAATLLGLAAYAREHRVTPTRAIRAALAKL